MRTWLIPALVVLGVVWAWWARSRMQQRHLQLLLSGARGRPARARTLTLLSESVAAALATAAVVLAFVVEELYGWWWLRILLAVLVIVLYVPYAMTLATVRVTLKVRRPPEQRMRELGAPPEVALAIAAAGRPFAYYGSVLFVAAVLAFLWHLFGR